jgi:uncharacterized protein DUF6600
MKPAQLMAALLALVLAPAVAPARAAEETANVEAAEPPARTPPRLSFVDGNVSFWRPGATDWGPAHLNTPLAPGDTLYAADGANLEVQVGARAFVRAGTLTQLGLDNQEPDFLQFKVTTGHAAFDLRSAAAGHTLEVDTPNAAFTIANTGYYRVDVDGETTTFTARRDGRATLTRGGGAQVVVAANAQIMIEGTDSPRIETSAAPEADGWDSWNYTRTDQLIGAFSAHYLPSGVYGAEALDHYGSWRVAPEYGQVWVPDETPAGWAPYSTGRWIWDAYYGWTWVDDAPWGWAPYHYGRWCFIDGLWVWAPGPLVVTPYYAPALVAFLDSEDDAEFGLGEPPIGWVALGWGEPVIPWWGPVGFIGVPCWRGWHGPHVVNGVVINRTKIVHRHDVDLLRNLQVPHAAVVVRRDRFGQDAIAHVRLTQIDAHHLKPVPGTVPVRPQPASLLPVNGRAIRPPQAVVTRPTIATRPPHDPSANLRAAGLERLPAVGAASEHAAPVSLRLHSDVVPQRAPAAEPSALESAHASQPPRSDRPLRADPPAHEMQRGPVEPGPIWAGVPRPQPPAGVPARGGVAAPGGIVPSEAAAQQPSGELRGGRANRALPRSSQAQPRHAGPPAAVMGHGFQSPNIFAPAAGGGRSGGRR